MKVVYPPNPIDDVGIKNSTFLAGTIEMGKSVDWQAEVINMLEGIVPVVFNPRRKDWDSSWVQSINNPMFKQQVLWEIRAMTNCSLVFMYFEPGSKSPITLLELGMLSRTHMGNVIVVCPDGFWRKGNVDIVCEDSYIPVFSSIEQGVEHLKQLIK